MLSTSSFFAFLPAATRDSAGSLLALADGAVEVAGAGCGFDAGVGGLGLELVGGGGESGVARVLSAGAESFAWLGFETACHWLASVLARLISSGVILSSSTPTNWREPLRNSSTLLTELTI